MSGERLSYGKDVRTNIYERKIVSKEGEMTTVKVEGEGHHGGGWKPPHPRGLGGIF